MNMPDSSDMLMALGILALVVLLTVKGHRNRGDCTACDGMGYRCHGIDGCGRCGGSGNLPKTERKTQVVDCEDCGATGYCGDWYPGHEFQPPEPVPCPTCHGTARVEVPALCKKPVGPYQCLRSIGHTGDCDPWMNS